ncbi:P-loop NTPase fold protein [Streptomyces sp. NPDC057620]|uniref:P-loop NTPase fold protein n=1 Tax=Streptomyces sp. NPDC057620 TaxID=3346185 RepID=UPI00369BD2E5
MKQLGARPQELTESAVLAAMSLQDNVEQVLAVCGATYRAFRASARRQEDARRICRQAVADSEWDIRAAAFYGLTVLTLIQWSSGAEFLYTLLLLFALTVCALAVALEDIHSRRQLWTWASVPVFYVITLVLQPVVEIQRRRWYREMLEYAAPAVVREVIDRLLGEDHDALLLADEYAGLRSLRGREYLVDNVAFKRLKRKIKQIDGGTIAVSGPRGVGKTSLLQWCTDSADFSVFAQAPAAYAPHDFLTSLFVQVCEKYIRFAKYEVPEFVRLPHLHRILGRLAPPVQRLVRWLAFAIPAVGLIVLGLFATVRSLQAAHGDELRRHFLDAVEVLRGHAVDVWHGKAAGMGLAVTCAGILIWLLRRSLLTRRVLHEAWRLVIGISAIALCLGPFVSLGFDPEVRHNTASLLSVATVLWSILSLLLWAVCFLQMVDYRDMLRIGGVEIPKRLVFGPILILIPLSWVVAFVISEGGRSILTDSENPMRICFWLLGILLGKIRFPTWSLMQPEPKLVRECRNQLYRLQTVQSSSAAVNTGAAAQVLSLGASRTTSLSTIPPNYPALVHDFRDLLADIAVDLHKHKKRFIVAIDEVDRLGTDEQALEFLREIKAILGVPHVYFLISVAEDVGAAFVRRGMPYRDVTDSAFDDVLHVQPGVLKDSTAILQKRADDDAGGEDVPRRFVLLAHALSGGIPRDLMRYARRLMEVRKVPRDRELGDLSKRVILDELSETLAGFRTLLAKQQWSPETSAILGSFRDLVGHLRTACPCRDRSDQLRLALEHFAIHARRGQEGPDGIDLTAETRLLIEEAAAYAYFSLTLLDIFTRERFNDPMTAASRNGPDGDPELLAEARLELAVSPYSARRLIDGIREAWRLAPSSANHSALLPPPRSQECRARH